MMKEPCGLDWAQEQKHATPPGHYALSLKEAVLFMAMDSPFCQVVAAYNYGFKRGRIYEKKARKP